MTAAGRYQRAKQETDVGFRMPPVQPLVAMM
jgi:hypothetical protein